MQEQQHVLWRERRKHILAQEMLKRKKTRSLLIRIYSATLLLSLVLACIYWQTFHDSHRFLNLVLPFVCFFLWVICLFGIVTAFYTKKMDIRIETLPKDEPPGDFL